MMELSIVSAKIWLHHEPVDFRKSIDGLYAIIVEQSHTALKESVFVFYNRDRSRLKLLFWHGNGFALLYKRLEKGKFTVEALEDGNYQISPQHLKWLIAGLDWVKMSTWKTLDFDEFI